EPIERVEGNGGPALQDPLRPGEVVVHLGADQVADDIARPPSAIDVRRARPRIVDARQERSQDARRAPQQVRRLREEIRAGPGGHGWNVPSRPKSSSMRTTSRSSGVETSIIRQVSMA